MTAPLDLDELRRTHVDTGRTVLRSSKWILVCDRCPEPWPCPTRQLLDHIADQSEQIEYMHGDPIITALETKPEQAREALAKYGDHLEGCRWRIDVTGTLRGCTCGLDVARAALAGGEA